jgi:four helix bundle protein
MGNAVAISCWRIIMASLRFQDLTVYQLAEVLADTVWEIVLKWNNFARDTVGKQLVRAADSVGANIAEGAGRLRFADNRRHVGIGPGSFNEVQHWLRRAFQRKLLTTDQTKSLQGIIEKFGPKRNAYLNSIGGTTDKKNLPSSDDSPNPDAE